MGKDFFTVDKVESIKLGNNLKVFTSQMPHMQSVSIVIGIKAGSIYETKREQGISHFIEHMLFKGTENKKDTLAISQAIEQLGGEINASTSEECTFLYCKVLHNNFEAAFEVCTDILNNSLFRKEDIGQEKNVVLEEINKYQDIPEDWITFLINRLMWKDSVLGQNVLGEKRTVQSFTRQSITKYFQERYQPGNMIISITGNISPEVIPNVLNRFPILHRNNIPKILPPLKHAENAEPELKLVTKKVNQAHLCFGFEGISRLHPDKFVLDLLNIILGGGLGSRLFQQVRVKEGLAYDIHSYLQYFNEAGSFNIYAGVVADKLIHSVEKILQELRKIKEIGVTDTELKIAKEIYKGSVLMGLENTMSYAFRLGSYALLYDKEYNFQEIIGRVEKVQAEDVSRVANNIFQTPKIKLAVFSPDDLKIRKSKLLPILAI